MTSTACFSPHWHFPLAFRLSLFLPLFLSPPPSPKPCHRVCGTPGSSPLTDFPPPPISQARVNWGSGENTGWTITDSKAFPARPFTVYQRLDWHSIPDRLEWSSREETASARVFLRSIRSDSMDGGQSLLCRPPETDYSVKTALRTGLDFHSPVCLSPACPFCPAFLNHQSGCCRYVQVLVYQSSIPFIRKLRWSWEHLVALSLQY